MPIDRIKVNEKQPLAFFAWRALGTITLDGWILKQRNDAILKKKTLNVTFYG